MKGAIATGNPQTSEAAKLILEAGGNAVDGAIAACLASFVAEPLLASAGGGGMMTAIVPGHEPVVIDFFSAMPGRNRERYESGTIRDFEAVEIDFGSAAQAFHVGRGSAAAPMALGGLSLASKRLGRIPLSELVAPAVSLATQGAILTKESANVFSLLWPINLRDPKTAAVYSNDDRPPPAGFSKSMPGMADLLRAFAEEGRMPRHFVRDVLKHFGVAAGGSITPDDLEVEAQLVEPRTTQLRDHELLLSPRLGGRLLALITRQLTASAPARGDEELLRLAEACRAGSRAKGDERALGSTTHISIVDGEGGAASVTLTNGEGCGHVIPGTDVQLNNFCGEEDLHPEGFFVHAPGMPLPSMIAPTLVRNYGGVMALGSGGANRIRSVVAQVLYRVAVLEGELESAILTPRVHAEEDAVWFEALRDPTRAIELLSTRFERVFDFPGRAFFFGGVHAVRHGPRGYDAFADPRRGGKAVLL